MMPQTNRSTSRQTLLLLVCAVTTVAGRAVASADDALPSPAHPARVVEANNGHPKLTVTNGGETKTVYELSPDVQVEIGGAVASIDDIAPGDIVTSVSEQAGLVTRISADRMRVGVVFAASREQLTITTDYTDQQQFRLAEDAEVLLNGQSAQLADLQRGDHVQVCPNQDGEARKVHVTRRSLLSQFWDNFRHNLFKPLLLFFYMGFSVPLLKIGFEFPKVIYQGLTIYLLVSIGWHGGEELAELSGGVLRQALLLMLVGFCTNFLIGIVAFRGLRTFIPKMRRVDAATVAAYYGSDSAGTFVTCLGVLAAAGITYAAYMPVMLAVMEIPGCLVGLFLVSRLRRQGMDALGNMPDEIGYDPEVSLPLTAEVEIAEGHDHKTKREAAVEEESTLALEHVNGEARRSPPGLFSAELLREVFLNPGLFLLFGGILIGFISRLQGHRVTDADDSLFVNLFQGMLCLFLLEMGMTAAARLMDLKTAGWRFILFGLLAPNIFATFGIGVAHIFSLITGTPLQLGTYALFAVLCGAASYIAVPAIQRLAIPEASPTLPLAASLGLTFSYNVTVGIPVYIMVAQIIVMMFPVGGS